MSWILSESRASAYQVLQRRDQPRFHSWALRRRNPPFSIEDLLRNLFELHDPREIFGQCPAMEVDVDCEAKGCSEVEPERVAVDTNLRSCSLASAT